MSSAEPDRNVLFGMTAWRLGIIDREAAMSAMYECTLQPNVALADVLQRQGKLSDRDRKRVDDAIASDGSGLPKPGARTVAHDARSDGGHDPAQTLETFDSAEQLRSALIDIISGKPHATIAASDVVLASDKTIAGRHTIDDTSFDLSQKPGDAALQGKSRFRVLRSHARGGLGEVFVAMDEEVKREVALKQILPRHADNVTSRTRFLLEAEVTGSLEHPGVVPVYGLGRQADGKPYYAMRFIRGMSLESAIEQYHATAFMPAVDKGKRALELRNLLTRFVAVCNTIEYAHSRGIAHRDLKPENIMLGPYGETLVVDWGLARPFGDVQVDADGEVGGEGSLAIGTTNRPTQQGSIVGTPQFMSPEQAMGKLELVGPRSDVYSLGATLYVLLTDQPAFVAADVRKVLTDVMVGNFAPPRQIKKEVSLGLDAICRKAMALKPEDRYASAKVLAQDIEKWLADEPVSALPETPLERMQRWMRRHKTWTQAGAVAIIAVAAVAATAYVREAGLRSDLQTALSHEEAARAEADAAKQAADLSAEVARREELKATAHARRAEEQNQLAMGTLKSVLFDIQTRLKNVPAAQAVRQGMLNKTIDGLKQVAGSLESTPDTDQNLVRAHLDLGDLFLEAGASEGGSATDLAEKEFALAEKLASKRLTTDAGDQVARRDLGAAYQRLGDVRRRRGMASEALPLLEKSLALRTAAAAEIPDDPSAQNELAATVQRLGLVRQELGEIELAESLFRRFEAIMKQLVEKDPGNSDRERDLAVAYERLGDVALKKSQNDVAEKYYRQSLEARKRLFERSSENAVAARDLSVAFDRIGEVADQKGDLSAAEAAYEESLKLRKLLYEEDPNNMQSLRDLLVSNVQLGDISLRRDKIPQAEDYFSFNHEIALQLAASDPANARFQSDLAASYHRLGEMSERKSQIKEARDFYVKRLEIVRRLAKGDPKNPQWQRDLSTALRTSGDSSMLLGDLLKAREYFAEYVDVAQSRLAVSPNDATLRRIVPDALFNAGMVELRLGDVDSAGLRLQASIDAAQKSVDESPQDSARRMFLANVLTLMSQRAWQARNPAEVVKWSDRATAEVRTIQSRTEAAQRKQYDEWLAELATMKQRAEVAAKAVADAKPPETKDPALAAELLDFQLVAALNANKFDDARGGLERLIAVDADEPELLFMAARRNAQIAVLDAANGEKLFARAVELLGQAQEKGFFRKAENAARLEFAPEFKSLQLRPAFEELLRKVRKENQNDTTKPAETKVT